MRRFVTRKRFHLMRTVAWAVQVPIALATDLKTSVAYLVFLSIAALIESSATDLDQALKDERDRAAATDGRA